MRLQFTVTRLAASNDGQVRTWNVRQDEFALRHASAQHERVAFFVNRNPVSGAARRHDSRLPKNRGFSICGPPSSGQTTSQLPQSLHASAKMAICVGFSAR